MAKGQRPLSVPASMKCCHGVALEERKRSVHQRGKEVQDYQQHKGSAAGPQVGPEALPYLDVKGFGVFLARHMPA